MTTALHFRNNSGTIEFADTHCHLDFNKFDDDRDKVLQRAKEAGISRILIPGTNLTSSIQAVKLAFEEESLFAAIGFQPNDSLAWNDGSLKELRDLYLSGETRSTQKIVAIGEIGLDYYWDAAPHPIQKQILIMQLDLAYDLDLPVVIHMREKGDARHGTCAEDMLEILGEWITNIRGSNQQFNEFPGVLHSFSGDLETAKEAIALGFFIGVTGPVTFKNANDRQEIIAGIDLGHLLLETDAPYLTPHPFRGKRNEPKNIRLIAEKIAEIHEVSLAKVAEVTNANAKKLFKW